MKKTQKEADNIDNALLVNFFRDQPVKRAFLFGSYAIGNATENSDVDIIVELETGTGLLKFSRMKIDLENLLNKPVDLLSATGISPLMESDIQKTKVMVYER